MYKFTYDKSEAWVWMVLTLLAIAAMILDELGVFGG